MKIKTDQIKEGQYLRTELYRKYKSLFPERFSNEWLMTDRLNVNEVIALYEEAIRTGIPVPYEKIYDFDPWDLQHPKPGIIYM